MRCCVLIILAMLATMVLRAQPVTETEALNLAHRIEDADSTQRANLMARLIDVDSFVARMKAESKAMKAHKVEKEITEALRPKIGELAVSVVPSDSFSYRLLRQYSDDKGARHLLFRVSSGLGVNYNDILLVRVGESVKASDIYVYLAGESLSQQVSGILETMIHGTDGEANRQDAIVTEVATLYHQGQYGAAKEEFDSLDPKMQNEQMMQNLHIQICKQIDDFVYESALDRFGKLFPDAPNTYLLKMDLYYRKGDYPGYQAAIDRLDTIVGIDPWLDVLRGNLMLQEARWEKALTYYEKAYAYDTANVSSVQGLVYAYAKLDMYDAAKKVIAEYRKTAKFREEDIAYLYRMFPSLQ
jgi:tetratricopeptide (TPR) repeat protein